MRQRVEMLVFLEIPDKARTGALLREARALGWTVEWEDRSEAEDAICLRRMIPFPSRIFVEDEIAALGHSYGAELTGTEVELPRPV